MSPVPFSLRDIDHIVLRVRDAAMVERFYIDVLGCTLERRQGHIGLTQLRAGRSLIDLVSLDGPLGRQGGVEPRAEARNVDHFCLRIEPYDDAAIRAHLAAHAVDVSESGERFGAEGLGPSLYLRDPEGNTVELKGPSSNSGPEN